MQHPSRFFARRFSLIAKICRDGSIPMALICPIQVSIRDASRAAKSLPEDAPEDPLPRGGPESAAQAMPENVPRGMLEGAAQALPGAAARSWELSRYMLLSVLLCVLLHVLLCVLFSTNFDPFLLFYVRAARVLYAFLSRPARGRTSGRKRNRMLPKGHPGFYGFM